MEDKIDAKIRMVGIRWQIWISTPGADAVKRDYLSKRARDIITELIALDESGYALYVQESFSIDKRRPGRRALVHDRGRGYKRRT
jgi:hypothetical protein